MSQLHVTFLSTKPILMFLSVLENIDQELSFKSNLKGIRSVEMFLETIEKSSVSLKYEFSMENEVSLTPPSEGFSNNPLHITVYFFEETKMRTKYGT